MLKIIFRSFCILAVAGVVCGLLYLFATQPGVNLGGLHETRAGEQSDLAGGMRRSAMRRGGGEMNPGTFSGGRHLEGDGQGDASLGPGLLGIASQAAKVALVTLAVVGLPWLGRKILRRKSVSPA